MNMVPRGTAALVEPKSPFRCYSDPDDARKISLADRRARTIVQARKPRSLRIHVEIRSEAKATDP